VIIDVHTHAFPDRLAPKAMEVLTRPFGDWKPARDGTLASLVTSMDKAGIDRCLVANIATRPEQGAAILSWSRQIASERIVPLGSVHPQSLTWEAELEAIAEAGLPGIKLHAQFQGFVLDDDSVLPLYAKAAELGLFVLFHAGFDISFPGDESASPRRLARVRHRVPKLVMIAAHMGGWQAWSEALEHLVGSDVYLDTSYIHQVPPAQLNLILGRHPSSRLVFGSDSPWLSQRSSLEYLRGLRLDTAALERMIGGNASALHHSLGAAV
jgi:predicted TIM-barrel fold metal-dependent hydrolase